ncbi:MAG TPA: PQQ-dependent sugar dehydrogenase [Caulobacteraceae bacterium]
MHATALSLLAAAVLTGPAAQGDYTTDAPGVIRKITLGSLPSPGAGKIGVSPPAIVARPPGAKLAVPAGFTVSQFAALEAPRQLKTAPNGDVFVSETAAGRVKVLRAPAGAAKAATVETFVAGLDRPFGIAFWPPGPNPQWIYIASANSVARYPYRNGDLKARGPAQTIVAKIAASTRDHSTRDLAFSPDGRTLFLSVGSGSNDAEGMGKKPLAEAKAWDAAHGVGAAWGDEADRADVLAMDPMGRGRKVFAAGIRNCVSMDFQPGTSNLWCAVNERDLMGDDLPPDYVTRLKAGGFYGWPWYYLGAHEDPHFKGERPDLAGKVIAADVMIASHSAALGMTFYAPGKGVAAFPAEYRGEAFVALHGSWNRAKRTGYKVVRVLMKNGAPTGAYQDFLTGFVADAKGVWGRPVGVAVARDGALLVTDDASGAVWRVAYQKEKK